MPNDKMSVMNNKYIHSDNVHPGDEIDKATSTYQNVLSKDDYAMSDALKMKLKKSFESADSE